MGCSFKKIELKIAAIKGPRLIITSVLATFVFSSERIKVILESEVNEIYNLQSLSYKIGVSENCMKEYLSSINNLINLSCF